jgi:hypothetical protein
MAGRAQTAVAALLLVLPRLLALPRRKPDATPEDTITTAPPVTEEDGEQQGGPLLRAGRPPEGASSTPDPCDALRVAIFDIDNTLTVGADHDEEACPVLGDHPAPNWPTNGSGTTRAVVDAVQAARDSGYKLAIASAESYDEQDNPKQREFLESIFGQDGILGTPAEQSSYSLLAPSDADKDVAFSASDGGAFGMKEPMITNIMKHYGVTSACWHRSVLIDDQMENNAAAHALGLKTIQSSPECGGVYCQWGCGISPQTASIIKKLATATNLN